MSTLVSKNSTCFLSFWVLCFFVCVFFFFCKGGEGGGRQGGRGGWGSRFCFESGIPGRYMVMNPIGIIRVSAFDLRSSIGKTSSPQIALPGKALLIGRLNQATLAQTHTTDCHRLAA